MRIVIDMQGAQSESRFRGIGRYTLSFAQAVARHRGNHEVILALNGMFPNTIEPIRRAFDGLLPRENIRVWSAVGPVMECGEGNKALRELAELTREAFLASLGADVVHISSLFEGYVDDAVTSIGNFDFETLVSVSLYDLIPLLNPQQYLSPNPQYERYYHQKVAYLKKAALLLAISEFACEEATQNLDLKHDQIVSISSAIEPSFLPNTIDENIFASLRQKFGISKPFILYVGGFDERKNVPRLISAFGALPISFRAENQLLIAGKISENDKALLVGCAKSSGLEFEELIFTGYVTDEELLQLYNLCKLFAFPSWHEGFGLPVLEAMSCGAPVIGANSSSLPEVIGLRDAMFDPLSVDSIASKLMEVLGDDQLRSRISNHGLNQAKKFSWEKTAKKALKAWESLNSSALASCNATDSKPRLAFVSPMPPEKTGIADFASELLPALAEFYEIDVVIDQNVLDDFWVSSNCMVRDVKWFKAHAHQYDRVLYHMGNSPFHGHMLDLLHEIPGVVVLHDFYLGHLCHWLQNQSGGNSFWIRELYFSHGYSGVFAQQKDWYSALLNYPCNFRIFANAEGVIVHSKYSYDLVKQWYPESAKDDVKIIPLLRKSVDQFDKKLARKSLGFEDEDFVICSFGFLAPSKLNEMLLGCWVNSKLGNSQNNYLIFVGENHGGEYGDALVKSIESAGLSQRVRITGYLSPELYQQYLKAANIAVQLRSESRGETSAAVLDCMNYGLPVVVNENGAMGELDPNSVWMLRDKFNPEDLVEALESLAESPEKCNVLGVNAKKSITNNHSPGGCAKLYRDAIEDFNKCAKPLAKSLINSIAGKNLEINDSEIVAISSAIAENFPLPRPAKRLFLDVTATRGNDLKTGIERVARALLLAFLENPPSGFRVEPVYLDRSEKNWHYKLACKYTLDLFDHPLEVLEDEVIDPACGDILLVLDLSGDLLIQANANGLYQNYRNKGVSVYSVIFDLLPILMPDVFPPGADVSHQAWVESIVGFDGALCISNSVAEELAQWRAGVAQRVSENPIFKIDWFHLGGDVSKSLPSAGVPDYGENLLIQLKSRPSFLMVGTLEPRKAYLQVLDAFTELWNDGLDINLVIVGREGWTSLPKEARRDIPMTVEKINKHSELGVRLFWLDGISDEYLERVYMCSSSLIAASYGEGFGLPLIEAAKYNLPIIARDIPVFKEVAGSFAFYFQGLAPMDVALAVKEWLILKDKNIQPKSMGMQCLTWAESAENLFKRLT